MHPNKFLKRAALLSKPQFSEGERIERLQQLSTVIAGKRKEAVDARKTSGIEAVWTSCEDAYLGVDDMNRHEFLDAKWAKPTSINGPVTTNAPIGDNSRSNAFVRLTSRYVDNASAKLGEILLPIDDKAFSFGPTPDPDLVLQLDDNTPLLDPSGQQVMRPLKNGEQAPGAVPEAPSPIPPQPGASPAVPGPQPMVPATVSDQAQELSAKATKRAELAEKRIYDWMVEAKYPAEARKVVHDAARIGTGVLKGPFPEVRKFKATTKSRNGITLQIEKKISPSLCWVDPWNIFPDDACGEDIHAGEDLFERDFLSTKGLKKLKDQGGYISSQIDQVIVEGPGKVYVDGSSSSSDKKNRNRYEIWYYYGTLKREDFELANADPTMLDDLPADQDDINVIVSMVNDTIIRAVPNPLDSGSFPFRVMNWSRRPGHWAGVGVGEQISVPQRMVNASTRAMLNNAGLTAGPQIIIDQIGIIPADGKSTITPNKIWYKTGDIADVRAAFVAINIPSVQKDMQAIVDYGMKLAEEQSGIPLVTQGQNGPTSPETFGAAELQDNNAHTWLRSVGYRYDDQITEPLVDDMYEWLLLDPTVPDEEKGDFQINAHGSVAMIEKAIQEQTYAAMLPATLNPAYQQDPAKWFAQLMKAKRMNPDLTAYTPEQIKQMQSQPPPEAPQVTAAKINSQTTLHVQDMKDQAQAQQLQQEAAHEQNLLISGGSTPHEAAAMGRITEAKIRAASLQSIEQSRATTELAYANTEAQMARDNQNAKMAEMQMTRELAILQYAHQQNLTLEQVRADLAKTAMVEQTKRQLAGVEAVAAHTEAATNRNHDAVQNAMAQQHDAGLGEADRQHTTDQAQADRDHQAELATQAQDAAVKAAKAQPVTAK